VRIAVVVHDYLPLHKGGSEIHAHQTARELARRGHQVTAVFTERDLAAREGELRRGELDGVPTIELVHQREYADVRETWVQAPASESFRQLLAELAPEVVHFHHLALWGSGAVRAAREAGARVVVTLHDYHLLCDAATLLRSDGRLCTEGLEGRCTDCIRRHPLLPERWGLDAGAPDLEAAWSRAVRERFERHRADLAAADLVTSPSRFLAGVFARAGFVREEDVLVLRAGYPGPVREPRRRRRDRPLRVGYVGGIYPSKGVHVLVEAFERLRDVPAELHVHGHLDWFPEYVAELRASAAARAEGAVRFHGPFPPEELDRVLAELDVLVVPSVWYENMPITIQEAFRNGLPVVATDLGGMAEAVRDGVDGLTFPRGDAAALAERLAALARDGALYDRLAAGRPAVLGLGTVVDRLEAAYRGA